MLNRAILTKTPRMAVTKTAPNLKDETHQPARESRLRESFFLHSSFGWCILSALLFWLAFPPVNWWVLAWIAPCGWIRVITQANLQGRRPILALYVAGWIHWLTMTYWVTLPHPWQRLAGWCWRRICPSSSLVSYCCRDASSIARMCHLCSLFQLPGLRWNCYVHTFSRALAWCHSRIARLIFTASFRSRM